MDRLASDNSRTGSCSPARSSASASNSLRLTERGSIAFSRADTPVPAGHCELIRIANRLRGDDVDRKVEIGCHSPHHRLLLKILLFKERDIPQHHVEQLADDG
ncbi:hypothetical protein NLM15_08020 [Bradyrhizobium sp. CCGB20]|nr:hypothetical protein [Bradyrhizobium sp. CCGB20]